MSAADERLRDALERIVASLESNGAWKVANALSIARAALRNFPEREKTDEIASETAPSFPSGKTGGSA